VNSEMHSEAVTERVWRCTCRLDRVRLEEYLEAVDLEGGATAAETVFIG